MIVLNDCHIVPNHLKMAHPVSVPKKIQPLRAYKVKQNSNFLDITKNRIVRIGLEEEEMFYLSSSEGLMRQVCLGASTPLTESSRSSYRNSEGSPGTPGSLLSFYGGDQDKDEGEVGVKPTRQMSEDMCGDLLRLLEPFPVEPPSYDDLPPGGCPKFAVSLDEGMCSNNLPTYSPGVYKIGLVSRKIEWLTPYEVSTSRSWKTYIMELNSTQLNFYLVPSALENIFYEFNASNCNQEPSVERAIFEGLGTVNSVLTKPEDLRFYKFCKSLGFQEGLGTGASNSEDHEVKNKLKGFKLVRSYSLQHSHLGLAIDYKKRPNVLRLRIESEQILLHFTSTKEVVDWNTAITVGRDISLDIQDRQISRERTLPRRRRRNGSRRAQAMQDAINRSEREYRRNNSFNGLQSKFSKLKTKLSVSKNKEESNKFSPAAARGTDMIPFSTPSSSASTVDLKNDDRLESSVPITPRNERSVEDEDQDDIQYISDLHGSDEEEEDDDEDFINEVSSEVQKNGQAEGRSKLLSSHITQQMYYYEDCDHKWNPEKVLSQKKYLRNCLRCIKPLTTEDSWVCKVLVKPATTSLVSITHMKNKFSEPAEWYQDEPRNRIRSFSLNNTLSFTHCALTRLPQHHLKEYIVGTHGLIPREF